MGIQGSGAIPSGSARGVSLTAQVTWSGNVFNYWTTRGGQRYQLMTGATNWGLSGEAPTGQWYQGVHTTRLRGGAQVFDPIISWNGSIAPANNFQWPTGLTIFEAVLAWPTNTAGVDNGVWFCYDGLTRVVTQAGKGIEVWNNNGVLTWTMNGQIAESVAINTGRPLTDLTKVRLEFRNATKNSPGNVNLLVNDVLVLSRGAGQVPTPSAAQPWMITGFGVLSNTEFLHIAQPSFYVGPDTSIGVP